MSNEVIIISYVKYINNSLQSMPFPGKEIHENVYIYAHERNLVVVVGGGGGGGAPYEP